MNQESTRRSNRATVVNERLAAQAENDFARLLSPLSLGQRSLRNRLVHGSMTTCLAASDGMVTQQLIDYHRNRAVGGAAMIVTDSLAGLPSQGGGHRPAAWHDRFIDSLSRWADAVQSEGCHLIGQLGAPGRARHVPGRSDDAVGASALPDDLSWTVPYAMSTDEVERMVEQFAQACGRLRLAGFSGVEFSCGHGHLIHQFLSPWSNRREDKYGGDLDGRLTLVRELIDAARAHGASDWIVGLKVPGDDGVPNSIDPSMAAELVERLHQYGGVNYFCPVQGAHARSLEMHMPDMTYPVLPYAALTGQIKQRVPDATVMAAGRIHDPGQAERLLADAQADLIMLGRALVADPGWLLKSRTGREADIRTCLSCNTCWGVINERRPIQCVTNPRLGNTDEVHWVPSRADSQRRIVVIGAGIAGLEAAATAARRGHQVTVFGASQEVGGKLRLMAALPGCDQLGNLYANQYPACVDAGVRFELGFMARVDDVMRCQPDAVVVASGSTMRWPVQLPVTLQRDGVVPDLRDAVADVLRFRGTDPGCAVIVDQDQTRGTYAAAELLSRHFATVALVTPREMIARDEPTVTRQRIYRRLYERRVQIELLSELATESIADAHAALATESALERGCVRYANVLNGDVGQITNVSLLTYATSREPDLTVATQLAAAGIAVHRIGDSRAPRGMLAATREGFAVGSEI